MRERRYDVDWLRVLAMVVVFYYHSARFFDDAGWHLKNVALSFPVTVFCRFADAWMMPLFLLLSGFAAWFALGFRTTGQYAVERLKRLFVPFLFGTLVIIPPQVYLERIDKSQFHGSYWQFYPRFFEGVYPDGNLSWHHLWFLIYLFVFSLLALPLLAYLRRPAGQRLVSRLASFALKPGGLFVYALPFIPIEVALRPLYPGLQTLISDWANFLSYLILFVYGYLIAADARMGQAVDRHWKGALLAGLCATGAIAFILIRYDPQRGYSLGYSLTSVLRVFNTWFWLIAILGAGRRYLTFSNGFLRYANEAVLPFYVLHQTVIIIIGFYVIRWHAGVAVKYLVITTAAFIVTLALYDVVVRRTNVTRFLFGMRPRRKVSSPAVG